jgi:hypothetical protein
MLLSGRINDNFFKLFIRSFSAHRRRRRREPFDGCVPNADIDITATTTASSLHVMGWAAR